ncbi:hypothetical protein CAEBREN_07044 [Caenorhabditis brenneri]|uniref:Uncharacterized protein n=1 Tax=Caenorhabditis brenneri TaxID=135651 RepID=G0NS40_CAEBE|nr:hypothetical protein CAEBREN_07044 [Caenorhabditis brenneri]
MQSTFFCDDNVKFQLPSTIHNDFGFLSFQGSSSVFKCRLPNRVERQNRSENYVVKIFEIMKFIHSSQFTMFHIPTYSDVLVGGADVFVQQRSRVSRRIQRK